MNKGKAGAELGERGGSTPGKSNESRWLTRRAQSAPFGRHDARAPLLFLLTATTLWSALVPIRPLSAAEPRTPPSNPVLRFLSAASDEQTKVLAEVRTALDGGHPQAAWAKLEALSAQKAQANGATKADAAKSGDKEASKGSGPSTTSAKSGPEETSDPLAPFVRYLRALTLSQLNRREEALGALGKSEPLKGCRNDWEDPIHAAREELRAKLLEKSEPASSIAILSSLQATPARLAQAAALSRSIKQTKEAEASEERLLVEFPSSSEAKALFERLGPSGLNDQLKSIDKRVERTRNLLDTHDNEQAETEALALLKNKQNKAYACELLYIVGKARRKLRNYAPSIRALGQARSVCSNASSSGGTASRSGGNGSNTNQGRSQGKSSGSAAAVDKIAESNRAIGAKAALLEVNVRAIDPKSARRPSRRHCVWTTSCVTHDARHDVWLRENKRRGSSWFERVSASFHP